METEMEVDMDLGTEMEVAREGGGDRGGGGKRFVSWTSWCHTQNCF